VKFILITILSLWASAAFAQVSKQTQTKPATEATNSTMLLVQQHLNFTDKEDFEDAKRAWLPDFSHP
jgi:alkyl sulfatase BDS1-like metallo-beta-lactamase superfamily hydrolase